MLATSLGAFSGFDDFFGCWRSYRFSKFRGVYIGNESLKGPLWGKKSLKMWLQFNYNCIQWAVKATNYTEKKSYYS